MRITFWGVRGSIATPGAATAAFGGNTTCIEVSDGDRRLVLDAGTGLRALGQSLAARAPLPPVYLLLTHTHWDHIQGLPFFAPIYDARNEIHIYGPRFPGRPLRDIVLGQFDYPWFPVSGVEIAARLHVHELQEEVFTIGPFTVACQLMNHPVLTLGYRVQCGDRSVVYTGDHEPCFDLANLHAPGLPPGGETMRLTRPQVLALVERANRRTADFARGVDVLVTDAQYTPEEYETKRGWGHSSTRHALDLAVETGARRLVLFHHDPARSDAQLEAMEREAQAAAKARGAACEVMAAREGAPIDA
jgi:phosphoribosyl 1,2-cyclic phosphodiesterase